MYNNIAYTAAMEARIAALRPKLMLNSPFDSLLYGYFQESEDLLIIMMTPPYTPPAYTAKGSIEFGWVLYWLNKHMSWLPGLPASKITDADWAAWEKIWDGNGVCTGDGTLVATQQYAAMDLRWALALIGYLENIDNKHALNSRPTIFNVPVTTYPKQISLGLFGDFGTASTLETNNAPSPSQEVMSQLAKLNPDILIHLGDVYYSGTVGEEQDNLLDQWKTAPLGNFTLNSNHEMYDGANGLFNPTLADPIFADQAASTFFQINYGNWIIVGLDSAYNATTMYMDGAITDPYQKAFLQSLSGAATQGKKILLLTHHNPIIEPGGTINSLWTDITGPTGLKGNPDYWYWGHIHNGIVYSPNAVTGKTACRCLGHAAIPFGNATWFEKNPNVSFFTNKTPNPSTNNPVQAMNGFAVLTLTPGGGIAETWYYQDGSTAWHS